MQRFLPFASAAEAGYVRIVKSEWTDEAISELETMDFTNNTHDDVADAISDAFFCLNKSVGIPQVMIPMFSETNQYSSLGSGVSLPLNNNSLPMRGIYR